MTRTRYFSQPQHPYTQLLLAAEPDGQAVPLPADAKTLLTINDLRLWFPIKQGFWQRVVGHIKAVDGISFLRSKRAKHLV